MSSGLRLENLGLYLGNTRLFAPFSIAIPSGSCGIIMGPSGCGKSCLLSAICGGLVHPCSYSGTISLNDKKLDELQPQMRELGILFQDDLLFPHLSVGENIALAIPASVAKAQRNNLVAAALNDVEMDGFYHRETHSLSGGQRVRVSLARCLSSQPKALLLDEPFSKLHLNLRETIRKLIYRQIIKNNLPCLLVTHDHEDKESVLANLPASQLIQLDAGASD